MPIPLAAAGIIGGSMLGGGIISAFGSYNAAKEAAKAGNRQAQLMIQAAEDAYNDISPMYTPYQQAGESALSDLQGWTPTEAPQPFDDSGYNVNAYLDPSMAFQQAEARKQLEQSASGSGGLYSGATMKALQDRSQDYAMQDYGNAFNRMGQDRQFGYQDYINQFNMVRQQNMDKYNQLNNLTTIGQNAVNGLANARTGQANQTIQAHNMNTPYQTAGASAFGAAMNNVGGSIQNIGQDLGSLYMYDSIYGNPGAGTPGVNTQLGAPPAGLPAPTQVPYNYGGNTGLA